MTSAAVPDNYLLELLDADARAALGLVPVQLRIGELLHQPGTPARHAYFPVSAVISLVSTMKSGASAEVALIGREGMVGIAGMLDTVESPTTAVVQVPGVALKATTAALRTARSRGGPIRTVLDRYTETRLIQTAQTAACNGLHSVEARLARWLLGVADRVDGDRFRLPQELMAQMLGIQRPTVSTTMRRFQDAKAIVYDGRSILVADRAKLEHMACECHGLLSRAFERLRRPVGGETEPASRPTAMAPESERESVVAIETLREIAGRLLLANIREQEAREEAEAANRAKDRFLATVSHELRTPLNAILGWCEILTEPGTPSIEHGLHVIQQNAMAQLRLVEELLDVVRLASSTLAIQPAVMDLRHVVQDVVDAAKPMADGKHVVLRLGILDELSPVLADADRLRQVFLNVVTNAVKFTEPGGCIDVSVATAGAAAQVIVRDTGRGIAAEMLPHVFERFRQGAPARGGSSGLGLGLTIAQAIVALHGGRIQMASPGEGQGATCTIDLPIWSDPSRSR